MTLRYQLRDPFFRLFLQRRHRVMRRLDQRQARHLTSKRPVMFSHLQDQFMQPGKRTFEQGVVLLISYLHLIMGSIVKSSLLILILSYSRLNFSCSIGHTSWFFTITWNSSNVIIRPQPRLWRRPPVRTAVASLGGGLSPDGSADTKALEPRFALNAFQAEQIAAGDEMRCEHWLFMSTKGTTDSHPAPRVPTLGTLVVLRESSPARVARFLCGQVFVPAHSCTNVTMAAKRAYVRERPRTGQRAVRPHYQIVNDRNPPSAATTRLPFSLIDGLPSGRGLKGSRKVMVATLLQLLLHAAWPLEETF